MDYFDWAGKRGKPKKIDEEPATRSRAEESTVEVEETDLTETAIHRIFKTFFKDREK